MHPGLCSLPAPDPCIHWPNLPSPLAGFAVFPLISSQIYAQNGDSYLPSVELFFSGLAALGTIVGVALLVEDSRIGRCLWCSVGPAFPCPVVVVSCTWWCPAHGAPKLWTFYLVGVYCVQAFQQGSLV